MLYVLTADIYTTFLSSSHIKGNRIIDILL